MARVDLAWDERADTRVLDLSLRGTATPALPQTREDRDQS